MKTASEMTYTVSGGALVQSPFPKTEIAIISRTSKFTDFHFGRYINSLHANETSLKI